MEVPFYGFLCIVVLPVAVLQLAVGDGKGFASGVAEGEVEGGRMGVVVEAEDFEGFHHTHFGGVFISFDSLGHEFLDIVPEGVVALVNGQRLERNFSLRW